MAKSKTQQALDLLKKNPGMTPYAAAKEAGVQNGAVYQAQRRMEGKPICPCCGQIVREGFEIDKSVLKKESSK